MTHEIPASVARRAETLNQLRCKTCNGLGHLEPELKAINAVDFDVTPTARCPICRGAGLDPIRVQQWRAWLLTPLKTPLVFVDQPPLPDNHDPDQQQS